jgi:hypothetical protein
MEMKVPKEEPMVCENCGSKNFITTSKGPRCRVCGELINNPFLKAPHTNVVVQEIKQGK